MTAKIRYRPSAGTASGRRTGWIKHVTSVSPGARDGHGVHGTFLKDGQLVELPVGAIILKVDVSRDWQSAHVYRLSQGEDGEAKLMPLTGTEGSAITPRLRYLDWRRDFLLVRDALAAALEREPENSLAGVPDEEFLAELRRRIEGGLNIQAWLRALSLLDS